MTDGKPLTPEELRAWLDRKPPREASTFSKWWREWFYDGAYLGERSARTGPDDVGAVQRCGCEQCVKPATLDGGNDT